MPRKTTDIVQLTLRLREELRRKLERAADKKDRSLNIEIVDRLEASFEAETRAREQEQMRAMLEADRDRLFEQFVAMQGHIQALTTEIRLIRRRGEEGE
jgi:predicted transcriptional regulator